MRTEMEALDEVMALARELRTESDRLRAKLDVAVQMRPPPADIVHRLEAECDQVLDKLTMFVVLAEQAAEHVETLVPTETRELRDVLERARELLAEVRP